MPVPAQPIEARGLLRDDVYGQLLTAIVDGTLAPGEQLRDQELAHWLQVSRTPIREALLRLGQTGLVQARPGRSTVVASVNDRTTAHATSVLASMHQLAVQESMAHLTAKDFDDLEFWNSEFRKAIKSGDIDQAILADDRFHDVFIAASANTVLALVVDQFTPLVRRAERLRFSHQSEQPVASAGMHTSATAHAQLISLCQSQDVAAIELSFNIWNTLENS